MRLLLTSWIFIFVLEFQSSFSQQQLPVAEVILTPSQQWRTAREESIRFREKLKRFIRKQFQIEKAEQESNLRGQLSSPLGPAAEAGLTGIPPKGTPIQFNTAPAEMRFQQRRSSLQSPMDPTEPLTALQDMMSQAINTLGNNQMSKMGTSMSKAGALLDSLQSPQAKAISQSLTNAVFSGRLPIASLMQLASALAPEGTQSVLNTFAPQSANADQATQTSIQTLSQTLPPPQNLTPVIPGANMPSMNDSRAQNDEQSSDPSKDQFWNRPFNSGSNSNGPIET